MTIDTFQGWVVCDQHPPEIDTKWCDHIKTFIDANTDALELAPGQNIIVPIMPNEGVFVEVELKPVDYLPGHAQTILKFQPDVGRAVNVDLGFWNPGEGRHSIRRVVIDFLDSRVDPREERRNPKIVTRCPNGAHSLASSRILAENQDVAWKWKCLWNIVMEKACTPCLEQSEDLSGETGLDLFTSKDHLNA